MELPDPCLENKLQKEAFFAIWDLNSDETIAGLEIARIDGDEIMWI